MNNIFSALHADQLDEQDELKHFRSRFDLPDNLIYLDGNSLGALPHETKKRMAEVVNNEWGRGLIRSWNTHWYDRPLKVGEKLAKLIGAELDEVIIADSTSVNLYKLAHAALRMQEGKTEIVSDELNFPSDLYIFQGLIEQFGQKHSLKLAPSRDATTVSIDDLSQQITARTALVSLSHVLFKSSFMYDMQAVNELAHQHAALVLWDLSHAVGAVPVSLNQSGADLAIGCTYKYLNGGPGSTAFLYVSRGLQQKLQSPIWGWFGQHNPFEFDLRYAPAHGMRRFLAGSPPLLSLSAIEPSLDMLLEAGMHNLRKKSISLSGYLLKLAEDQLFALGYVLGSPKDPEMRGSHVSLRHPEAFRICQALINPPHGCKTVIPDFREPDFIRLGIAPLYNTFTDIYETIVRLRDIVAQREYIAFSADRAEVT
jgi:kynureninase